MQVDLLVHPAYRGIEDEMLAWAETMQRVALASASLRLTAWAFTRDAVRTALCRKRGYTRTDEGLVYMSRSLEHPPPQRILPPGYSIRSVSTDEDIKQRVAVHRAAFAPSQMSKEGYRLLVREAPTYRADLDLVVVAPDGNFAAFCLIWLDTVNALGVFEPVGCHPDYQQRGLTRAVIEEGLRRLHDLGARAASVNSHRGDKAAARLYVSTGFREIDCMEAWQKGL
jgi:mycothiol synthase